MTADECMQGQEEQKVFREWFEANILSFDPETLSNAIMIMPYGSALPVYRDVPNEYASLSTPPPNPTVEPTSLTRRRPPGTFHTLTSKMMSPVLQIPQLVFPSQ
jgi:hypothetical protein